MLTMCSASSSRCDAEARSIAAHRVRQQLGRHRFSTIDAASCREAVSDRAATRSSPASRDSPSAEAARLPPTRELAGDPLGRRGGERRDCRPPRLPTVDVRSPLRGGCRRRLAARQDAGAPHRPTDRAARARARDPIPAVLPPGPESHSASARLKRATVALGLISSACCESSIDCSNRWELPAFSASTRRRAPRSVSDLDPLDRCRRGEGLQEPGLGPSESSRIGLRKDLQQSRSVEASSRRVFRVGGGEDFDAGSPECRAAFVPASGRGEQRHLVGRMAPGRSPEAILAAERCHHRTAGCMTERESEPRENGADYPAMTTPRNRNRRATDSPQRVGRRRESSRRGFSEARQEPSPARPRSIIRAVAGLVRRCE